MIIEDEPMVYVAMLEPNSDKAFAITIDKPKWKKDTAKQVAIWIKKNYSVKHTSMAEGEMMVGNYLREKKMRGNEYGHFKDDPND